MIDFLGLKTMFDPKITDEEIFRIVFEGKKKRRVGPTNNPLPVELFAASEIISHFRLHELLEVYKAAKTLKDCPVGDWLKCGGVFEALSKEIHKLEERNCND